MKSSQLIQQWQQWHDRDPLKREARPYRFWQRAIVVWLSLLAILLALVYWNYRRLDTVTLVQPEQLPPLAAPHLDTALLKQVTEQGHTRAQDFESLKQQKPTPLELAR